MGQQVLNTLSIGSQWASFSHTVHHFGFCVHSYVACQPSRDFSHVVSYSYQGYIRKNLKDTLALTFIIETTPSIIWLCNI